MLMDQQLENHKKKFSNNEYEIESVRNTQTLSLKWLMTYNEGVEEFKLGQLSQMLYDAILCW